MSTITYHGKPHIGDLKFAKPSSALTVNVFDRPFDVRRHDTRPRPRVPAILIQTHPTPDDHYRDVSTTTIAMEDKRTVNIQLTDEARPTTPSRPVPWWRHLGIPSVFPSSSTSSENAILAARVEVLDSGNSGVSPHRGSPRFAPTRGRSRTRESNRQGKSRPTGGGRW